jgi:CDP-glycerol glycerophosphotransferase (TagB/SpsB family)
MLFDADARCRIVGQPLTLSAPVSPAVAAEGRPVVLYAPTWEGAQPSVAYSSVLSHGELLIRTLLADGRFTVLYRPHPLIGVTSRAFALADRAIREAIEEAGEDARVVEADDEPLESSFARAAVLVCDVSAVATAWLPSLKPIVVTEPTGTEAVSADSGMLSAVPRLRAEDIGTAPALLERELADDAGRAERERLVAYYLSPYWPHALEDRFVAVCTELMDLRDRLRGELLANGATGV